MRQAVEDANLFCQVRRASSRRKRRLGLSIDRGRPPRSRREWTGRRWTEKSDDNQCNDCRSESQLKTVNVRKDIGFPPDKAGQHVEGPFFCQRRAMIGKPSR